MPRTGSAFGPGPDRESQIAALLTVRDPATTVGRCSDGRRRRPASSAASGSGGSTHYTEARIEPGDVVTVIGPGPAVRRARRSGGGQPARRLAGRRDRPGDRRRPRRGARPRACSRTRPAEAWGNAAIEGFGIGQPVRAPELDPAATPPPPPDPALAARAAAAFDIAAGRPRPRRIATRSPLLVSLGAPAGGRRPRSRASSSSASSGRVARDRSAMALALLLDGGARDERRRRSRPRSPSGCVVAIVLFLVVATYNDVVALQRRIDKAWANIEVALQQRHDQLPALVDAVRGLMTFERDVLTEVTAGPGRVLPDARRSPTRRRPSADDDAGPSAPCSRPSSATPRSSRPATSSPLQEEIERLEAMIADRRELYNDQVYRLQHPDRPGPGRLPRRPVRLAAAAVLRRRARQPTSRRSASPTPDRPSRPTGPPPGAVTEAEPAADPARPRPPRRDRVVEDRPPHGPDGHPADRRRARAGAAARRRRSRADVQPGPVEPARRGRPRPPGSPASATGWSSIDDLREWDYGVYEGRTRVEIAAEDPGLDGLEPADHRRREPRRARARGPTG